MLDNKERYLQIAFNYDLYQVKRILPGIPFNSRILIEAGTPFIKKEGIAGIRYMRSIWQGKIVADLKTADGAIGEVDLAEYAGANAVTVLGNAPIETLDLFILRCKELNICSMIDTLGLNDPLSVLMQLEEPPDVVVLHKGRDEETTKGKIIKYKHINKIKSKFDVLISAAGGVDLRESRSAIFNGANIVVVNIVSPEDSWVGIGADEDIRAISEQFLRTIE